MGICGALLGGGGGEPGQSFKALLVLLLINLLPPCSVKNSPFARGLE